jgi:hypothetical protein
MSGINGDKSRHAINRKRGIARRAKIRTLLDARTAKTPNTAAPPAKSRPKPTAR